jgi:hypothetical protein
MKKDPARSLSPALRLGLACLLASLLARGATAATLQVANLADSGPGSLRQAVLDANADPGADEITFAPGLTGAITLTSGEILITAPLAVDGPGAGVLTVSGNDHSRIFHVENSAVAAAIEVTLSGLTLTHGRSTRWGPGGAVFAKSEDLTILDSVISDSSSGLAEDPPAAGCGGNVGFFGADGGTLRIVDSTLTRGAAVDIGPSFGGNLCLFGGKLILERSTLSDGFAESGGGLYIESLTGDSTIVSSTISGNQGLEGGGIAVQSLEGTLTIESSTISGNTAGEPGFEFRGFGGGLYLDSNNLQIINSTVSGNRASGFGGGILFFGDARSPLLLRLTTVSNNTAGKIGGSLLLGGDTTARLDHSIVANGAPQDLAAFATDLFSVTADYSLIEAPGGALLVGAHNLVGVDPLLGPLAGNGGPTLTHRPLSGSPVIDAGDPAIPSPPATDQRGFARIFGAAIDLGSVEVRPELAEVPALSQVGTLVLAALLFAAGVLRLRRRSGPA